MDKKTVLITGCSSGFGKLAALTFQKRGWNVIATMRSPEKETELNQMDGILVSRLDVTDQKSIDESVRLVLDRFGRIDVLVNNAGYGGFGLYEQIPVEEIRSMFETNVFGLMNVTRAVLPHMRSRKQGVIINITSLVGILAIPSSSVYSASKFAVRGFSEALALELKPLNIAVKTIAPGHFDTNFNAAAQLSLERGDDELKAYAAALAEQSEKARSTLAEPGAPEPDSQDVADLIYQCAIEEMPVHNAVGNDTQLVINMRSTMPEQDFLDEIGRMLLP